MLHNGAVSGCTHSIPFACCAFQQGWLITLMRWFIAGFVPLGSLLWQSVFGVNLPACFQSPWPTIDLSVIYLRCFGGTFIAEHDLPFVMFIHKGINEDWSNKEMKGFWPRHGSHAALGMQMYVYWLVPHFGKGLPSFFWRWPLLWHSPECFD